MKVTKDMIEAFIGSDQEAFKYLEEIANGEYKAEQFKEDVINYNIETRSQDAAFIQFCFNVCFVVCGLLPGKSYFQ